MSRFPSRSHSFDLNTDSMQMISTKQANAVIKSEWEKSFESILHQTRQTLNRINQSDSKYSPTSTRYMPSKSSYQSTPTMKNEMSESTSALNLQSSLLDRIMDRLRNLETTKQVNRDCETLHLQNQKAKFERTLEDLQLQVSNKV